MPAVPEWLRKHGPALGAGLAVAALALYAYLSRVGFLLGSPFPFGVDGYYYPVQLRSLLDAGQLNYPSAPLVFWLLAPLAALTDPVVGTKLGAAAGTALMVVPAYLLARRLSGERLPALLGAALVATSAESFYLATEFVKEGVGLTIAVGFVAALAAALDRPSRGRVALAALLLVAALLAHKTAFGLALVAGGPALAVTLWRRGHRRALAAAGGVLALALAAAALAPRRFLGAHDLALLSGAFRAHADWRLPALDVRDEPRLFAHEVAIAGALALLLVATWVVARLRRREGDPAAAPLPVASFGFIGLALALAIPWLDVRDPQGLGFRVRLLAFVTLAPLAALLVVRALAAAPAYGRGLVAAGIALGLLASKPARAPQGVVRTHPAMVAAVMAMEGVLPEGVIVVTHDRKVAFMVRWYLDQPARLQPPDDLDPARTYRLMTLRLMTKDFRAALDGLRAERPRGVVQPRDLHPMDANGMVLMPEATFQYLLGRVKPETRDRYLRWPTT